MKTYNFITFVPNTHTPKMWESSSTFILNVTKIQLSYEFLFSNTLQILGQEFSYMQYKLADYVLTNFLLFFQALKFVVGVVGMVERLMVFSSREFYLEDLQIKMVTFFQFQMSNQVLVYCRYYVYLSVWAIHFIVTFNI